MAKKKISRTLANSRISMMSGKILENSSHAFGIDLSKMDSKALEARRSEIIDILTEDFEEDFEIVPPDC